MSISTTTLSAHQNATLQPVPCPHKCPLQLIALGTVARSRIELLNMQGIFMQAPTGSEYSKNALHVDRVAAN
jgi:hypothetical protein